MIWRFTFATWSAQRLSPGLRAEDGERGLRAARQGRQGEPLHLTPAPIDCASGCPFVSLRPPAHPAATITTPSSVALLPLQLRSIVPIACVEIQGIAVLQLP
jgi:hypothetical protein